MKHRRLRHEMQVPPRGNAQGEEPLVDQLLDARRYFWVVLQRRWLVIACVVVSLVTAVLLLQRATPQYSAATVLMYDPPRERVVDFGDTTDRAHQPDEIRTQIEIIRSPRVIGRVIAALGLDAAGESPAPATGLFTALASRATEAKNALSRRLVSYETRALDPKITRAQRLEEAVRNNVDVSQVDLTRMIRISVTDTDRERAARIAEEFASQYMQSVSEDYGRDFTQKTEWFAKQIDESKQALAAAEQGLHSYKGKTDIRVLEQNFQIATSTMSDLSKSIESTRSDLAELVSQAKTLENEELRRATLSSDTRSLSVINKLKGLELDRVALVMQNTPNHPDVVKIDGEIEVLNSQLAKAADELIAEVKARQEIAAIGLASLQERLAKQEDLVQTIQEEMIQYRVLEREVESAREIYTALLDRSKQTSVTGDISTPTVTVMQHASIPEYPSSPKIMRTLALFGVFGLFCGLGLVFVADKLDRSVKDPREVEAKLALPTLGTIPHLRESGGLLARRKGAHSPLVSHFDPKSHEAESFRVLRTALQYSHPDTPPRVLLVSSSFPEEGKSTIAANMAISYAQRGDKVLLIDCDLKRAVMHRIFDISKQPGLSDVLTGQKKFDEVVVHAPVEHLDLLSSGPTPPSPGDLLESRTMKDMLAGLREKYSLIILDAAPLAGISDSLVLSHSVDGICLVVSRGRTPMDALSKVVALLDQVEAPLLGVIYNNKERRVLPMREGGRYPYYGYGYGYGVKQG